MSLDPDRSDGRRRIGGFDPATQRTVIWALIGGGLFFALVVVGAVYGYIRASGRVMAGDVRPTLEAFMERGRDNDPIAGHALLSANALRDTTPDSMARLYARREAFAGFETLEILTIDDVASTAPGRPRTVEVTARAFYEDERRLPMRATMELDDDRWRILDIGIGGATSPTPVGPALP